MKTYQDFVKELTVDATLEQMNQFLLEYDEFKKHGIIGDCSLRRAAEAYCETIFYHTPTVFMDSFANEVARFLARKFLDEKLK